MYINNIYNIYITQLEISLDIPSFSVSIHILEIIYISILMLLFIIDTYLIQLD